uniref:HYDIN/VesB/CFA65-like Ig-like domain-containing protein n=1 Tax=Ficedula albicollis TaxID=59894 RepID=A0A803W1T4_FICAL
SLPSPCFRDCLAVFLLLFFSFAFIPSLGILVLGIVLLCSLFCFSVLLLFPVRHCLAVFLLLFFSFAFIPSLGINTEGIQVHPCELCACTSTAESALEKGSRKDVTRAQAGLLLSCFHKWQNHCFMSFLQFNRLVKISMERSPYFELLCPNDAYHIVPPGASSTVRIRFTPDTNKNYSHQLVCITGLERIVVPIRANPAQAILEFPDQLDFSECPVKYSTQKTVLLRNVGNLEAQFQLSTQSPFSVVPASGTLGIGETMQVTVGFHPLTIGDHSGTLAVCCNTGEKTTYINLRGEAVNVAIQLSTNSVKFEDTFITMSSYTTLFIENRSNITAHFQWKTFPMKEEDDEEKKRLEKKVAQKKGFCEDYTAILSDRVQEDMARVEEDPLLFSYSTFLIEPIEGEIEPNCCAKITVTFKPLKAREYQRVVYCDISGHETRLPLCLRGEGQGPLVELSYDTLAIGSVLLDTTQVYEVKLINKGAIDAHFTYIPPATEVGDCFGFLPDKGIIAPGGIQTIKITFNALVLGNFEEQFQFSVAESPNTLTLTASGCVCEATVHFDMEELNFGDISFGFPYTMTCRLVNTSPGFLNFKLRMSDDGTQPAVTSFDQILKPNDSSWRDGIHFYVEPREFTINPSQGTITPLGYQDIMVTLCSNTVMEFYRRLLVDLEGIGKEMATLIISARYQHFPEPSSQCLGCSFVKQVQLGTVR